ncbi:MAG TPA: DUF4407 domain-containing protein [Ramlibacter sp.]|nr:DUF4407 domain-containing protein [Ramlibacter sp.]
MFIKNFFLKITARFNRWYERNTSGLNTTDRDVMQRDGSSLCRVKARFTEKLVFGASLFSGAGVGIKVWTVVDGLSSVLLAPLAALLWSRYLYALECRIVSALPPVPTAAGKVTAVLSRCVLAAVFASIQAVPIVWVALTGAAKLEAVHMQMAESDRIREQVVKAHGLADLAVQGELLATDVKVAAGAIDRLPAAVTEIQVAAAACDDKLDNARRAGMLRIGAAEGRMRTLAGVIMAPKTPPEQRQAAEARHGAFKTEIERIRGTIRQAEADCADRARAFAQAKDEYRKTAGARREGAQAELDRHRRIVREREEQALADIRQLKERTARVMLSDEGLLFQAAWKVLIEQAWARGLALVVVIAFLAVDLAAVLTKALTAPGPYEHGLAARDAIAAAASRRRIEAARRQTEGEAKFHMQDQGAMYARRLARENDLEERAAQAQHDVEMVRRRLRAISELTGDLETLEGRTANNPGIRQLLDELLRNVGRPAATAARQA